MDTALRESLQEDIKGLLAKGEMGDANEFIAKCEDLEIKLFSEAMTEEHFNYFTIEMLAYLSIQDTNNARHLWRRLQNRNEVKEADANLPAVKQFITAYSVAQAMWNSDVGNVYGKLAYAWSNDVAPIASIVKDNYRQSKLDIVQNTYSCIKLAEFAVFNGSDLETAVKECETRGWVVETKDGLVYPKKPVKDKKTAVKNGVDQLERLSTHILNLENNLRLAVPTQEQVDVYKVAAKTIGGGNSDPNGKQEASSSS